MLDLGWQNGKRIRKPIYGRTRREVADKLTALHQHAAAGAVTAGKVPTVEAWMDTWLETAAHRLAAKTHASYAWIARTYVVPALGRRRIDKLTGAEVQAMVTGLLARGLSKRSAQYAFRVLAMALKDAVKLGVIRDNAADRVSAPRPQREQLATLTAAEARKLLEAARTAPYGALWVVALTSGMRQGELLALQWRDVDLDARTIRVRDGKTHRARRVVPLTQVAADMLGQPGDPMAPVFPSSVGTPLEARNVVRVWHGFCDEVLGRRVRFHDLRHTAATLLLAQGVPLRVISDMLGHSSIQVTSDVYVEVVDALKADAAARMDAIFGSD
jgi:integrase